MPRATSSSPFYPPRARWYTRPLVGWDKARHRLALDRIRMPKGISIWHFVGGLLIPGLAIYLRGPAHWGKAALAGCAWLTFLFVLFMGYPLGNLAFGLLIGVHVTGFIYLVNPILQDCRFRFRILFTVATLVMISCLLYFPARNFAQRHWFMPLRSGDQVIIIHRTGALANLRRGAWIAYSLEGLQKHGAYVRSGYGFGPILGAPGDRVRFTPKALEINDVPQPRLPRMPAEGTFVVNRNHWFVWPELARQNYVQATEANLTSILLSLSTIRQDQVIGVPYKRWFWRRQM